MRAVHRFIGRHSLFIFPGVAFALIARALSSHEVSWVTWTSLAAALAVIWTIPIWLRHKPTVFDAANELTERLRSGKISLLHLYSDF